MCIRDSQRTRRMRHRAPFAALARRHGGFHARRHGDGLRGAAPRMNALGAFLAGLVFGVGLLVSGMTDPGKVIGFLDLAGAWDPSLAFVMGGAVLVGLFAFGFAKKRARSFFGGAMHLSHNRDIDNRLVGGSLVFGVGWGLAGFCPGPALVSFAAFSSPAASASSTSRAAARSTKPEVRRCASLR